MRRLQIAVALTFLTFSAAGQQLTTTVNMRLDPYPYSSATADWINCLCNRDLTVSHRVYQGQYTMVTSQSASAFNHWTGTLYPSVDTGKCYRAFIDA